MRNVKSKNCQTDKDVLLSVEGHKKERERQKEEIKRREKILFIFCERKPISNG